MSGWAFELRIGNGKETVHQVYGSHALQDGVLTNVIELPNTNFDGMEPFVVVNWGDRTYLLTVFEIEDFRDAISAGTEPRKTAAGAFWLKVGDWNRNADGEPVIPAAAIRSSGVVR